MAQSVAMGPMGSSVPVAFYPVGPVYPPGSAVLVEGGFDAGARFATGAPANIPVSWPCNIACAYFVLCHSWGKGNSKVYPSILRGGNERWAYC